MLNFVGRYIACIAVFVLLIAAFTVPFLKLDSKQEETLRSLAFDSAERGDISAIEGALSKLTIPMHIADANASLAYAYHRVGNFDMQRKVESARYFNRDSYLERSITHDILSEPGFMRRLLNIKYLGNIDSIKSDYVRSFALYVLGVSMGSDGELYTERAFEILSGKPDAESRSIAAYKICRFALNCGRREDFVRFLPMVIPSFESDLLVFESIKDVELQRLWMQSKTALARHNNAWAIGRKALAAAKSGDENTLKYELRYYALRYEIKWRYNNLLDFNYPLYAYFARLAGNMPLYKHYLEISRSAELKERLYGNIHKYKIFSEKMFRQFELMDRLEGKDCSGPK